MNAVPVDGRDQSCAACGSLVVAWVHPLDRDLVTYRHFGKGATLPTFWCICDDCEAAYVNGDDALLARRFFATQGGDLGRPPSINSETWFHENGEKPIAVWRRADLGARPLPPG